MLHHITVRIAAWSAIVGFLFSAPALAVPSANLAEEAKAGGAIYAERCTTCHDKDEGRAPPRFFLETRLPREVVQALTTGPMKPQATGLDDAQIRSLAIYLTGHAPGPESEPNPRANLCRDDGGPFRPSEGDWNGWGQTVRNTRFQPNPGLKAEDLPRLKVKWAFALPGVAGSPVSAGGRLFVTSRLGSVYALDAATGCTHWSYETGSSVRNAVTIVPLTGADSFAAIFGDLDAAVYALDPRDGKLLWKTKVDDYPSGRIVGSITAYKGRIYVPITSGDELEASSQLYSCCKFRGSLVALDAATGKVLWKSYTIPTEAKPTRMSNTGVQLYGPAGAGIWASPTIDAKRNLVYVGTGDSYTNVPTDASDSVVALDLDTGKRAWVSQVRKGDDWIYHCTGAPDGNCPSPLGPDYDFSSPPVLETLPNGHDIIVDASKAAILYAFDPAQQGKLLWQTPIGRGGSSAPIWGVAVHDGLAYIATPGPTLDDPPSQGEITAIDMETGKVAWRTATPHTPCSWGEKGCQHRQPVAVSAMPGAVLAGSLDAHLRAYGAKDGKLLWDFDTAKTYQAVNGIEAQGGNLDGAAVTVANGAIFVNSGNATQTSLHPGNAVLAITIDGK